MTPIFDTEVEHVHAGIRGASGSDEAKALALLLLNTEDGSLSSALRRVSVLERRLIYAVNSYDWKCSLCGYRDSNNKVWLHVIDTCGPAHLVRYAERVLKEK